MKYIIYLLSAYCLTSCVNNKERIVNQIKDYKDSSRLILDSIVKITVDETLKYEELYFTDGKPDYDSKVGNPSIRKIYTEYLKKNKAEQLRLTFKQSFYKNKIDSLELELKKY